MRHARTTYLGAGLLRQHFGLGGGVRLEGGQLCVSAQTLIPFTHELVVFEHGDEVDLGLGVDGDRLDIGEL
jgi:hypothetical protein